ncbi:MAG: hypothetical protein V3T07_05140, partial [Myxococcota bacterium]
MSTKLARTRLREVATPLSRFAGLAWALLLSTLASGWSALVQPALGAPHPSPRRRSRLFLSVVSVLASVQALVAVVLAGSALRSGPELGAATTGGAGPVAGAEASRAGLDPQRPEPRAEIAAVGPAEPHARAPGTVGVGSAPEASGGAGDRPEPHARVDGGGRAGMRKPERPDLALDASLEAAPARPREREAAVAPPPLERTPPVGPFTPLVSEAGLPDEMLTWSVSAPKPPARQLPVGPARSAPDPEPFLRTVRVVSKAQDFDAQRAFRDVGLDSNTSRQQLLELDGRFLLDGARKLEFKTNLLERRQLVDNGTGVIRLADGWTRQRNAETDVRLSLYDGRLRFASRFGLSSSSLLPGPLAAGAGLGIQAGAVHDPTVEHGIAMAHRLDAVVWDSEFVDVSAFGHYSRVSSDYVSLGASGKESLFADSDQQFTRFGGQLDFGPLSIELSHNLRDRGLSGSAQSPTRLEGDQLTASLSIDALRELAGAGFGDWAWRFAPNSLWVDIARGRVESLEDTGNPADATRDASFGLSWYGDQWSTDVSFWRSVYDTRYPGAEDADWVGSGAEIGSGFYGDRWEVYATLGMVRSADLDPENRASDLNLEGSVELALRPERLPDISTMLNWNRYEWNYYPYGGAWTRAHNWSFTASLDLSKYLRPIPSFWDPSL